MVISQVVGETTIRFPALFPRLGPKVTPLDRGPAIHYDVGGVLNNLPGDRRGLLGRDLVSLLRHIYDVSYLMTLGYTWS